MGVKLGLSLKEEHGPTVFEERVRSRISSPKREAEARKLRNEKLRNLYSLIKSMASQTEGSLPCSQKPFQILLGWKHQYRWMEGACSTRGMRK
jgi:hypothetical protein